MFSILLSLRKQIEKNNIEESCYDTIWVHGTSLVRKGLGYGERSQTRLPSQPSSQQ